MIGFVRGKVFAITVDTVLIDRDGIGFRINFARSERLKVGDTVTIYTYQHVREDDISLFGFLSLEEYELFTKLISVKGLGPKIASNALAVASVEDITNAIALGDVDLFKRLPGIGAKTASQIILDLKGKLTTTASEDPHFNEATEALKALGYKNNEFAAILRELYKKDMTTDELIKESLKILAKKK